VPKICTGIVLAMLATAAIAGSGSGLVTGFIPGNPQGTTVFVFATTTVVDTSSTRCNTTLRFAIASTDPKYKETIAAVLEAHATGTPVTAVGTGNCTILGNAEDLNYLCVGTIPC